MGEGHGKGGVYSILCKNCPMVYTGETGRIFGVREIGRMGNNWKVTDLYG